MIPNPLIIKTNDYGLFDPILNVNKVSTYDNKDLIYYPNPSHNQLTISNIDTDIKYIYIYDLSGKLIKSYLIGLSDIININISELPNGVYFLKGDNKNKFYKFIKQY